MSYFPNHYYSNDTSYTPSNFELQLQPSTVLDSIIDFSYTGGPDVNGDSLNKNDSYNFSYLQQPSNGVSYSANTDFTIPLPPQHDHSSQRSLASSTPVPSTSTRCYPTQPTQRSSGSPSISQDQHFGEGVRLPGRESTRSRRARSATSPYRRGRDNEPSINTSPGGQSGSRSMASTHRIIEGEGRSETNFANTSNLPHWSDITIAEKRRQRKVTNAQKYRDKQSEDIEELRESLPEALRGGAKRDVCRNAIGQLKSLNDTVEDLRQMVGTFVRELGEKDADMKKKDETIAQHEATIAQYEQRLGEFQKWYDEIFIPSQTTQVPWRNP